MNNNNVIVEARQFQIVVGFNDGEMNGKPLERKYGFMLEAKSEPEARVILRRHLLKMVEELSDNEPQAKKPKNPALKPETDTV